MENEYCLEEEQPLSLSGLKSLAVLEDDQMSFQRLFFAAGGGMNDRPSGPFPNYIGGHVRGRSRCHGPQDATTAEHFR